MSCSESPVEIHETFFFSVEADLRFILTRSQSIGRVLRRTCFRLYNIISTGIFIEYKHIYMVTTVFHTLDGIYDNLCLTITYHIMYTGCIVQYIVTIWSSKLWLCVLIICKTCNLKHVRRSTRPID